MADWSTIAALSTGAGTLVLAVATFSSVRSSQRSARVAERSLLLGLRPVLIPSRAEDPPEEVRFGDGRIVTVHGGEAALTEEAGNHYMVIPLRNAGSGLAVLHAWHVRQPEGPATQNEHASPEEFRRQQRDLYVPAGDRGFWQGAVRETGDPFRAPVQGAQEGADLFVDLLYGDHEGGQRTVSRFVLSPRDGSNRFCGVVRHWSLDTRGPRT